MAQSRRRLRIGALISVVAMLVTTLTFANGSANAADSQRTLMNLDATHIHTDYFPTKAQQSNSSIVNQPSSYLAPTDYFRGNWYIRVHIKTKPSNKVLWGQVCLWQHGPVKNFQFETCSPAKTTSASTVAFDKVGVYYVDLGAPSSWWTLNGVAMNWSKKSDFVRFMLKDPVTKQLIYTRNCGSTCFPGGAAAAGQHMPINMDVELIMVGKNDNLNPPNNWTPACPSNWANGCSGPASGTNTGGGNTGGGGGGGGTTPTPTPTPNTGGGGGGGGGTTPTPTPTPNTGGVSAAGKVVLLTNSGAITNTDTGMKAQLEAAGHSVLALADNAITEQQAQDAKLIVISSSVTPSEVPSFLASVDTPLLNTEAFTMRRLGMAGSAGETATTHNSVAVSGGHPIAGSFSSSTTVMNSAAKMNVASPSSAADVIATVGGQAAVYAYDDGDSMSTGTAPDRRVGFMFSYPGGIAANSNAYSLFNNAVAWLLGSPTGPTPTPSPTPTGTPTATPTATPTPGPGGDALLLTNRGRAGGGDANVLAAMQAAGYTVDVVEESKVTAAEVAAADVVVISSSVVPSQVPGFLATASTPIVVLEAFVFDDLGMTTSQRDLGTASAINIIDSSHPIAGGLSGTTTVLSPADRLAVGVPAPSASVIATYPGNSNLATVFAYDAGDALVSGTANAKRVGVFLSWGASSDANATGWQVFTNALNWADA